ncbi:hypothetical protein ACFL6M_04410, partial [Candidatus Eisenbacteria bacterium]
MSKCCDFINYSRWKRLVGSVFPKLALALALTALYLTTHVELVSASETQRLDNASPFTLVGLPSGSQAIIPTAHSVVAVTPNELIFLDLTGNRLSSHPLSTDNGDEVHLSESGQFAIVHSRFLERLTVLDVTGQTIRTIEAPGRYSYAAISDAGIVAMGFEASMDFPNPVNWHISGRSVGEFRKLPVRYADLS